MNYQKFTTTGRTTAGILTLAAVYYLFGQLGFQLSYFSHFNHELLAIWPPTGVSLAVLVLWGYRWFPGVFIGSLLLSLEVGLPLGLGIGLAASRAGGVLATAWLVNRFAGGPKVFEQSRSIFLFVLLAGASTLISTSVRMAILVGAGQINWAGLISAQFTFWMADLSSNLLLTPCLIIWVTQPRPRWGWRRLLEGLGLLGVLSLLGLAIFCEKPSLPELEQSEWLLILPILWAAFRFGRQGAISATLLIFSFALWGTTHRHGPFGFTSQQQSVFSLQLFIGILSIMMLVLVTMLINFKHAEQTIRLNEEHFRQMFENALQGAVTLDNGGKIKSMNLAAQRILGRTQEEFLGRTLADEWHQAIHDDGSPFLAEEHPGMVTLRTGSPMHDVVMGILNQKKNHQHWININTIPIFWGGERQPHAVFVTFDDITLRHALLEQIRSSEDRYRRLAESLPDGVYVLDQQSVFKYVNPTAAQWLGLAPAALIGRKRSEFFPPEVADQHQQIIDRVCEIGQMQIVDWEAPYGTAKRWVETRYVPLGTGKAKPTQVIGISRDLTEQHELQRQILKISAEERQRIGHDLHDSLGQHLAGIAFLTKALENGIAAAAPAYAGEVNKITTHVNDAIKQTRCLAQFLAPVEVLANNLPAALAKMATDAENIFKSRITFSSGLDKTACDAQTSMVFYRIAQEAIHNATQHGAASNIDLQLWQEENNLCLRIRDDGKGFPLPSSVPPDGMGVAIMNYRARSVGGKVTIKSETGKGVEVTCRVPLM